MASAAATASSAERHRAGRNRGDPVVGEQGEGLLAGQGRAAQPIEPAALDEPGPAASSSGVGGGRAAGVVDQVPEGSEPAARPLQHGHPARRGSGRRPAGSMALPRLARTHHRLGRVAGGCEDRVRDRTRPRRTPRPGRPPGPRPPPPGRRPSPTRQPANRPSVSAPVPQTSSGLPATRPGSSRAASRCSVAGADGANGTPSVAATSTTRARSAPESCTVAMPRPLARAA